MILYSEYVFSSPYTPTSKRTNQGKFADAYKTPNKKGPTLSKLKLKQKGSKSLPF